MSNGLLMVLTMLFVQWGVILLFPKRVGRGWVSRKMWRWPWFRRSLRPIALRERQFWTFWLAQLIGYFFGDFWDDVSFYGFCGLVIVLYLDDYLFGDDDNFRRFWEGVRNRIKWKMKLPQPAIEPRSGTG